MRGIMPFPHCFSSRYESVLMRNRSPRKFVPRRPLKINKLTESTKAVARGLHGGLAIVKGLGSPVPVY